MQVTFSGSKDSSLHLRGLSSAYFVYAGMLLVASLGLFVTVSRTCNKYE